MQQIKIDELRLDSKEVTFHIEDTEDYPYPTRQAVWDSLNEQFQKLQRIADLKGKIIAFVPEGYDADAMEYIPRSRVIKVEGD
uniref:Uncharacterized protein n=1 Tax=viral metagenome TaxID=1070528 RepID=A0A6M3J901_9ZZZZ